MNMTSRVRFDLARATSNRLGKVPVPTGPSPKTVWLQLSHETDSSQAPSAKGVVAASHGFSYSFLHDSCAQDL